MAGNPPGFNPTEVRNGLRFAMTFGIPEGSPPTFVMPTTYTAGGDFDSHGVPWHPDDVPVPGTPGQSIAVPCAVEYTQGPGKADTFSHLMPSKILLTLLDEEYQQIKGFEYVVINGNKYLYRNTQAPVGLGSIEVWQIVCESEDMA